MSDIPTSSEQVEFSHKLLTVHRSFASFPAFPFFRTAILPSLSSCLLFPPLLLPSPFSHFCSYTGPFCCTTGANWPLWNYTWHFIWNQKYQFGKSLLSSASAATNIGNLPFNAKGNSAAWMIFFPLSPPVECFLLHSLHWLNNRHLKPCSFQLSLTQHQTKFPHFLSRHMLHKSLKTRRNKRHLCWYKISFHSYLTRACHIMRIPWRAWEHGGGKLTMYKSFL